MKWKAFFVLLGAYVFGVATCTALFVILPGQPHATEQFMLWIVAGAICIPGLLQSLVDW
jgi:hypothetical protein